MPFGSRKLRVVIDTNVFISGLNFAGKPGEVLDLLIKEEMEVLVSPFILSELESILRNKFGWEEESGNGYSISLNDMPKWAEQLQDMVMNIEMIRLHCVDDILKFEFTDKK